MTLSREIIYLVRLNLLHKTHQIGAVRKVAIVKNEVTLIQMGILIKMIYSIGIE